MSNDRSNVQARPGWSGNRRDFLRCTAAEPVAPGSLAGGGPVSRAAAPSRTARVRRTCPDGLGPIHSFAFSSDGRELVGINERADVFRLDPRSGKRPVIVARRRHFVVHHAIAAANGIAFDGYAAPRGSESRREHRVVLDVPSGRTRWERTGPVRDSLDVDHALAISRNGELLARGIGDHDVVCFRFSQAQEGRELFSLPSCWGDSFERTDFHPGVACFSNDGSRFAIAVRCSKRQAILVASLPNGRKLAVYEVDAGGRIVGIEFSPDDSQLAALHEGGELKVWSIGSGAQIYRAGGPEQVIHAAAFHPDGALIGICEVGGELRVQDLSPRRSARHIPFDAGWVVEPMVFSPDGSLFAVREGYGQLVIVDWPG